MSKKETIQKRETRSRHEKKRREEMNQVLSEMMTLLPEDVGVFKMRRVDQKPRQPDKCFIIGNAVEVIRKSVKKPHLLSDPLAQEIFHLTNAFLITLNNFLISNIQGNHRSIFDLETSRMVGKDIRCYLDFESGSKLSFLNLSVAHQQQLQLRSFLAKSMTCSIKSSVQNPSEMMLVCVPDTVIPPENPAPVSPPPSQLAAERPILAALLRRKDPPPERRKEAETAERALKMEMEQRKRRDLMVSTSMVHTTPITSGSLCDSASTSSCSFLSPSSSTSAPTKKEVKRATVTQGAKRKRLRSVNAIVESFPLDEVDEKKRKVEKASASTSSITLTNLLPSSITPSVTMPTTSYVYPITTSACLGVNPYDVLAPGYRDIWLRLQSERLLLEKRIVAKEGELKNLMLTTKSLPSYIPPSQFLSIPQYPAEASNHTP